LLKLTKVLGCTLIVHQQIHIRQILIYNIRIRRKRISAGSVTFLLCYMQSLSQRLSQSHVWTGFVKTHVLVEHESEVVGEISASTSQSPRATCSLLRLRNFPKVVVVTCDVDVKAEETFVWTQQVR